jgi:hypothetical protein
MKTIHLVASVLLVATSAAAGFHSQPATVGPPLVCFQYDIGTAKSLPWGNNADDAFDFDTQYDVKNLIPDTLAILRGSDDALGRKTCEVPRGVARVPPCRHRARRIVEAHC